LGGACNTLPSNLTTAASPFSGVAGCSGGKTWQIYQTASGNPGIMQTAVKCPLSGSRVTRSQVR
jgi:hypothetical protein